MLLGRLNVDKSMILKEILRRNNRLLFFDMTGISQKKKTEKEWGKTDTQQGDLISLLTKIRGGYTDSKVIS
jgi:hypothetical protein